MSWPFSGRREDFKVGSEGELPLPKMFQPLGCWNCRQMPGVPALWSSSSSTYMKSFAQGATWFPNWQLSDFLATMPELKDNYSKPPCLSLGQKLAVWDSISTPWWDSMTQPFHSGCWGTAPARTLPGNLPWLFPFHHPWWALNDPKSFLIRPERQKFFFVT